MELSEPHEKKIITDIAIGKTLKEAKKIGWKEAADALDGLPPIKMHCSVLAVDTLHKAIKDYEVKHNLAKADKFDKETIVEELKKVIYPQVGEDIVTLKMVKYAGFENGVAIIDLEIPKFDKYRDNVVEEIKEHLEHYKEIKEVNITI